MIIDVSGVELIPGNYGQDCPGNGLDDSMECCCDECEYMMCCFEMDSPDWCIQCNDKECPNSPNCEYFSENTNRV